MRRLITGLAGVCLTMLPIAARAETVISVTQTSYDVNLRPQCVAVRMDTSVYGSLSSDACTPGAASSSLHDRVTKTIYDGAGQVTEVDQAYGITTANGFPQTLQRAYARYSYNANGTKATETDANGNTTEYDYDGFDRVSKIQYPSATTAGQVDSTDYETFGYDSNGNKTSWRRRNGATISYTYDALNRETSRSTSDGSAPTAYSDYDLAGRPCIVAFTTDVRTDGPDCTTLYSNLSSTQGIHYKYDGLERLAATRDMNTREVQYTYNQASVATNLIYPDGANINYTRDSANRLTAIGYNASSGLIREAYDNLGRRTSIVRRPDANNNAQAGSTSIGFDNFGRVTSLTDTLASASYSVTWSFGYNPASQIISTVATNEAFTYGETSNNPTAETYDGLNRDQTLVGTSAACPGGGFDKNYNLICDGTRTFTYDVYNHLLTATGNNNNLKLVYDPLGRLAQYSSDGGANYTDFLYDGTNLIGEYPHCASTPCSMTPNERYIHGDGVDEPLVWFHGGDTSNERFFVQDYHGSVIAYTDASGNLVDLYKYGPYGEPKNAGNWTSFTGARFRYTGQVVIPEASLYYYKARVYDPIYGRFLQTDPIGSKDDLDLYAYTGGDPVDKTDPTGNAGGEGEDIARAEAVQLAERAAMEAAIARGASEAEARAAGESAALRANESFDRAIENAPQNFMNAAGNWFSKTFDPVSMINEAFGHNADGSDGPEPQGPTLTLALGKTGGLSQFASVHGADTYESLKWGENWKTDFLSSMGDSSTRAVVNLDNIGDPVTAAGRGAGAAGDPMDWELSQIYQNRDWWGRIDWYKGGREVSNPFQ